MTTRSAALRSLDTLGIIMPGSVLMPDLKAAIDLRIEAGGDHHQLGPEVLQRGQPLLEYPTWRWGQAHRRQQD